MTRHTFLSTAIAAVTAAILSGSVLAADAVQLLNVSYDPTRELYTDYNKAFAKHWKAEKGQDVTSSNPTVDRANRPAL